MADRRMHHIKARQSDAPMIRCQRRAYFAYGANMSPGAMKMRCPRASFVCAARLQGQFRINGYGVATIVFYRPTTVHGVLWTVTASDETALDVFEGIEAGLNVKRTVASLRSPTSRSEPSLMSRPMPGLDHPAQGT